MDILNSIAIRIRCLSCGGAYLVPLSDVLLSHQLLHQGCPVAQETECPPPFQARLAARSEIEALERSWQTIEKRARMDGGELVWIGSTQSDANATGLTTQCREVRDPEDRRVAPQDEAAVREKMLDKTLADSYPASDPPSSLPNPSVDSMCAVGRDRLWMEPAA